MRPDAAREQLGEELRADPGGRPLGRRGGLRRVPVVRLVARRALEERRVVVVVRVPDVRLGSTRGVWTRPGALVGSIVCPLFQRDSLSGPVAGLSHSNSCGLAGSSGWTVEVPLVVGDVRRHAHRPAVVGRRPHDLDPARALRPAMGLRDLGVGRVVGHVGDALRVDLDAERVPEAHGVDLRPRVRRAGGEQVAGRNRVGAVVGDLDPQRLAAQVVGVQGTAPRVDERRVEPVAFLRRGVRDGRGRADQRRAVGRHLRHVLLRVPAAEVDRHVGRVDRPAGRDHVARLDVAQRLERGLDGGGRRVPRDRRGRLAVERERERARRRRSSRARSGSRSSSCR